MKHFSILALITTFGMSPLNGQQSGERRQPTIGRPQPVFNVESRYSAEPTDTEFLLTTVFSDRLVPMSGEATQGENVALANSLRQFQSRTNREDISMLEGFVQAHPSSRWNASLFLNMGIERYEQGYLTLALQFWESAWALSKTESDLSRRAIADRAIGEVVLLNARLGRMAVVEELLLEVGDRPIEGSVATMLQASREGITRMRLQPGIAFKCGPFALNSILNFQSGTPHAMAKPLDEAQSSPQGTNLLQVKNWATEVGLDYQVAKRAASGQIIHPSVMHWKLDHFAALLTERDGRFLVQDATFGGTEMWVSADALAAETDGYFLVPSGPLPPGWRTVTDEEAETIWGKGGASAREENAKRTCPPTNKANPTCPEPGMPVANYYLMHATSNIQDIPLFYQPPVGPAITFLANYNHNETGTPEINTHSHLGPNWDFNWVSYLEVNPSYGVNLRLRDGGTEVYHFSLFNNLTNAYAPDMYSQAILKWTTDELGRDVYRRELSDGSAEIYSQPGQTGTVGRYYLKNIVDPQGNKVTINYEVYRSGTAIVYSNPPVPGQNTIPPTTGTAVWTGRINEIVDAAGGVTSIRYLSNVPTQTATFRKIKSVIDPYGRTVEFTYDGSATAPGKINSIKDAIGMVSRFTYAVDGFIEEMTTPYGKTLFHRYNRAGSFEQFDPGDTDPSGEEIQINDLMRGLKITYPNGSTSVVESWLGHEAKTFHWNRLLTKHYPLEPQSGNPSLYQHCEIYAWRMNSGSHELSAVPASITRPLEGTTSFEYENDSEQTFTVGEGGAAQQFTHNYTGSSSQPSDVNNGYQQFSNGYNLLGNITETQDPRGRRTRLYYDGNGIDLLELRQVNGSNEDLLVKMIYNNRHLPEKVFDAAGELSEFEYNSFGQVTQTKDALGRITRYTYIQPLGAENALAHDSLLESVDGPLPGDEDVTTYTYDGFQRVESVTNAEGDTTWFEYDELNRVVKIIYQPEGVQLNASEYEEVIWDRLKPVLLRDRQGRWTRREYDSMGLLIFETDSQGRHLEYDWCTCGSLTKFKDGNGNLTRWEYDDLGRIIKKIRADGREEIATYYSNQNRLQFVTIAGETRTEFTYNTDDSIAAIHYFKRSRDTEGNPISDGGQPVFELDPKTPGVSYTYGTAHLRLTSISSSQGSIGYSYHPYRQSAQAAVAVGAGALSRVDDSALSAATLYSYDALGRVRERAIYSVVDNVLVDDHHKVEAEFDELGRPETITNVLGTFDYEYLNSAKGLSRLSKVTFPNGQESLYSWLPAAQYRRLGSIVHQTSAEALISEYSYGQAKGGRLRSWTQRQGTNTLQHWELEHDDVQQLRSVVIREGGPTGAVLKQHFYNYDQGGNRTSYQEDQSITSFAHNSLNQIVSKSAGGKVRFEGVLNESGTVTVAGQAAHMRTVLNETDQPNFRFSADVELNEGTNDVEIIAKDGNGNETTVMYNVEMGGITGQTVPAYDARGNMLTNGRGQTYEWDVANRLTDIHYTDGSRTEFFYDALGRRWREVERNATDEITSEKRLLWCGLEICQQRSAQNAVIKRYTAEGVVLADDTKYHYARNHLNSIVQVTAENEGVVESYEYDAYGNSEASVVIGERICDFRYTGHRYHEKSGLHLAVYRAYDSKLGVWLCEDPIQESGGINLYSYAVNSPVMAADLLGLDVTGSYSISSGTLNFVDNKKPGFFGRLFGAKQKSFSCSSGSGTGKLGDVNVSGEGPLPPGKYNIYSIGDRLSTGPQTYLLDPVDSSPGNDRWDGRADGISRGMFRIHMNAEAFGKKGAPRNGSDGCLVNSLTDHGKMNKFLQGTKPVGSDSIVQPPTVNNPENFGVLPRLGTLTVTP